MSADPGNAENIPRTIGAFLLWTLRRIAARRRWLLLPLWILIALISVLILLAGGSVLLPVIYIGF